MVMSLIESLTRIKNAVYGREVREAIHDGVFRANQIADGADDKADKTQIRQDAVENFNNQVIQEMTDKDVISAPEIIQARGGKATLGARLDDTTAQLAQTGVQVVSFGGGVDVVDNHDAIMSAIQYASANDLSKIILPAGEVRTSPLNLQGHNHITLEGTASLYYPDQLASHHGTTLKIISEGDIAVQLNGTTGSDGMTEWRTVSNQLKNIKIDCNKMTRAGINGTFDVELDHVYVVNALEDGIIMESTTYPFKLKNVFSAYNGRHGLYAKSPFTTVYYTDNCEFSRNGGYGLLLEGGTNAKLSNTIVQANKQGGVKVNFPDESNWDRPAYLQRIHFDGVYTEANGTLDKSDPDYEGNWAVVIDSDHGTKVPTNIKIENGSVFQSNTGGTLKINAGSNIYIDVDMAANSIIEINKERVQGLQYGVSISETMSNIKKGGVRPYFTRNIDGIGLDQGLFPSRGRTTVLYYYLDSAGEWGTYHVRPSITLPSNVTPPTTAGFSGYPVLKPGSILYISAIKTGEGAGMSGNIRITPKQNIGGTLKHAITGEELVIDWDLGLRGRAYEQRFSPGTYPINRGDVLGFEFQTRGHGIGTYEDGWMISVLVEY